MTEAGTATKFNEVGFWDTWNSRHRSGEIHDEPSKRRMQEVLECLIQLGIRDAKILEIGCGTGWLSKDLTNFGAVTAVDLAEEVIKAAKVQMPEIDFRAGDIFSLGLPANSFDVVVTLETFSHVRDQKEFLTLIADLLKPNGHLILTTQNKYVFERKKTLTPQPGYIRKWVTMKQLKQLLVEHFSIQQSATLEPDGHRGVLRIINSYKLNRVVGAIVGAKRLQRFKESLGLGQTLFAVAVKR